MSLAKDSAAGFFKDKWLSYTDTAAAKEWFSRNYDRISEMLDDGWVRDLIFEPVKGVFEVNGTGPDYEIRSAITRVAVVNAVLAGLPGKMGIGVFVSVAFEAWMAYVIATRVGVKVEKPSDIFAYFSLLAGVGITIIWVFKSLLGFLFSLFSIIPWVNPLIPAELLATNLIGILFWIGFEETARTDKFNIPKRALGRAFKETRSLFRFQWQILSSSLSPQNLALMRDRASAWLRGEIQQDYAAHRGELFPTIAMAYLIQGEYDKLGGPVSHEFVEAIRDRYPELADATVPEIGEFMSNYDEESMSGVVNMIKGKLFERMVVKYENADGDDWHAEMFDDEFHPGSDIVLSNSSTGEAIEVSLKATLNPDYVETAMLDYPEIPVMGPEELTEMLGGDPGYMPSEISHGEVLTVTEENFDELLAGVVPFDEIDVAATGVAVGTAIGLWPFVVAYIRGKITYDHLKTVLERGLGQAGKALASRISYAAVLGVVFAWFLLARGVVGIVKAGEVQQTKQRRIVYAPSLNPVQNANS